MQYNISPETLIQPEDYDDDMRRTISDGVSVEKMLNREIDLSWMKGRNITLSPSGQFFRTDTKGFLPEMLESKYNDRKRIKNMMLDCYRDYETGKADESILIQAKQFEMTQWAKKISLNSAYGNLGTNFSRYYDVRLASSVTAGARLSLLWVKDKVNKWMNKVVGNDIQKEYIIAGDTDSLVSHTKVYVNGQLVNISNLFETCPYDNEYETINGHIVRDIRGKDVMTCSFDGEKEVETEIHYVMKHTVNKRLYEVFHEFSGNSVIVTEDHSLIFHSCGDLVSASPMKIPFDGKLIIKDDGLVYVSDSEYRIKDLGVQELDVYDIETDNHMFFANDILVHNSLYIHFQDIVKKAYGDDLPSTQEVIDFLSMVASKYIEKVIDDGYEELAYYVNAPEQKMKMKREVIAERAVWTAKKRYAMTVYNGEDNVTLSEPHYKIVGLEIIKSSTPKAVRNQLMEAVKIIMTGKESDLHDYVKKVMDEFFALPPEEISFPKGVNGIKKYSTEKGLYKKGTPINSRAAILYNSQLKEHNLDNKYQSINEGDKIRFIYLIKPNPLHEDVIGFPKYLPKEFGLHKYIDYYTQFEKVFLSPLENILKVMGWDYKKRKKLF